MSTKKKKTSNDAAQTEVVKTALTWGHKITLTGLWMAGGLMFFGMGAVIGWPQYAENVIRYVGEWQPFCTSVVVAYNAKTTVENAMKIYNSVKCSTEKCSTGETNYG